MFKDLRLTGGDAAGDGVGRAAVKGCPEGIVALDAAAELYFQAGAGCNLLQSGEILRSARLGAVQIDQMQTLHPGILIGAGHVERLRVIHLAAVVIAFGKAHAAAFNYIYGWDYLDHSAKKFLSMCSPTGPLFSGWNWQAKKLSRESAALKVMPWVDLAMVSAQSSG